MKTYLIRTHANHQVLIWKVLAITALFLATILSFVCLVQGRRKSQAHQIAHLEERKQSLEIQLAQANEHKRRAQHSLAEEYLKEKISGIYTYIDSKTGVITIAPQQLAVQYEQGRVTIAFYDPYFVAGTGNTTATSAPHVMTTPSGDVLGTFSVKLLYDFAAAQTSSSASAGTIYTMTTSNGRGTSSVQVKLVWGSIGGSVALQIGSGVPSAYIKNSYVR